MWVPLYLNRVCEATYTRERESLEKDQPEERKFREKPWRLRKEKEEFTSLRRYDA